MLGDCFGRPSDLVRDFTGFEIGRLAVRSPLQIRPNRLLREFGHDGNHSMSLPPEESEQLVVVIGRVLVGLISITDRFGGGRVRIVGLHDRPTTFR